MDLDEMALPWQGENCFHVVVVGTMSSGKSTLIDALLGTDCMPSANMACTSKIISICQQGDMKKLIGVTVSDEGSFSQPMQVTKDNIKEWNQDKHIRRIILSGQPRKWGRSNFPLLVMHDTPGTNDAKHPEHLEQVLEFLRENAIDLIMFVIDGKYSGTNSQQKLAAAICKELSYATGKTNILFLFNKLDCYDPETESVEKDIETVKTDIETIGYKNPFVLPISAKAAKLFRAMLERRTISAYEMDEYKTMLHSFCGKGKNVPVYFFPNLKRCQKKRRLLAHDKDTVKLRLRTALQRTGLTALQDIIYQNMTRGGKS